MNIIVQEQDHRESLSDYFDDPEAAASNSPSVFDVR